MKAKHCFSTLLQLSYLTYKCMKQAWIKMMVLLGKNKNDVTKGTC